jgi:hypothetical protein
MIDCLIVLLSFLFFAGRTDVWSHTRIRKRTLEEANNIQALRLKLRDATVFNGEGYADGRHTYV